jgi:hypothetical protein
MKVTCDSFTVDSASPHFDYFMDAHRTNEGAVKYAASFCERQFLTRCDKCNHPRTHIDIEIVEAMTNSNYSCGNCLDNDEKGKSLDEWIDVKTIFYDAMDNIYPRRIRIEDRRTARESVK